MESVAKDRAVESALAGAPSHATPSAELTLKVRKRFAVAEEFSLDVAFSAEAGFTILFGASGAGKTTLLDCIAGLVRPDAGVIRLGKRVFFDDAAKIDVKVSRRNVGYVFQTLALFPHLTVDGNVAYGLQHHSAAERERRIAEILGAFRISGLHKRRPDEISGGERQRVALARSLVTDPCVLLLDEPLAALDFATKSRILDDLREWNEKHRIPIFYVTHSREEVFALGNRVVVLDGGRVVAEGSPHKVMSAPRQETVAQLAGFENIFDVDVGDAHEDRGTMSCRLLPGGVPLETPMVRVGQGVKLRVGIRAGDILLATSPPEGLSARNIFPGKILKLERRDVMIAVLVDVGVTMEVHVTLAARDALQLDPGLSVWLIVKTYSCQLMSV
jgi:molybdate transport system ATP-binding protein